MYYMVNSASAPLWKTKQTSTSSWKKMWNYFIHVQLGQAAACSREEFQLDEGSTVLCAVDTEVLEAARAKEVVWLYQHGALCRLISPAKKRDGTVPAKCFEVPHKWDDAHLRGSCLPLGLRWTLLRRPSAWNPGTSNIHKLESVRESTLSSSHGEAQWFAQDRTARQGQS